MRKKKVPSPRKGREPWVHWCWGPLASLAWVGVQVWHLQNGTPFSWLVWIKGQVLLTLAASILHFSRHKGWSFLGLFPLLWLALSKFQWELCLPDLLFPWVGLALFMVLQFLFLLWRDGQRLFFFSVPGWIVLSWLMPFTLFLPFSYLFLPQSRWKGAGWLRWGGLVCAPLLFLLFHGWNLWEVDWVGFYGLFVTNKFISFFLLGWLGLAAFPSKSPLRCLLTPQFLLALGFLFLDQGRLLESADFLRWVLVFSSGFGLESFRRDVMDQTWHGKAVWAVLGLGLLAGVV